MAWNTEFYADYTALETLLKDTIPNRSHVYLSHNETGFFSKSCVYTLATTLFTVVGQSWVNDSLIGGTVGVQIGSIYYLLPITDNATSTITVNPADEEAELTVTLVNSKGYHIKVFGMERFLGETFGTVQTPNIEKKDYVHEYPERTGYEEITKTDPVFGLTVKTTGKSLDKYLLRTVDLNAASTDFTHTAYGAESGSTIDYFIVRFKDRKHKSGMEAKITILNASIWLQGDKPEDAEKDSFVEVAINLHAVNEALAQQTKSLVRYSYEK